MVYCGQMVEGEMFPSSQYKRLIISKNRRPVKGGAAVFCRFLEKIPLPPPVREARVFRACGRGGAMWASPPTTVYRASALFFLCHSEEHPKGTRSASLHSVEPRPYAPPIEGFAKFDKSRPHCYTSPQGRCVNGRRLRSHTTRKGVRRCLLRSHYISSEL